MNDDCPFCQIVAGDLPSYTLAETDEAYAFLDINPVSPGHSLVIPKQHGETLDDLDERTVLSVFALVNRVASAVTDVVDADGYNILQSNGPAAGQEVPHMHVHIIPRVGDQGLEFSFDHGDLREGRAEALVEQAQDRLE